MNGHDSTATMLTTVNETTIKNAFAEIMNDESLHVSFFRKALTQAGATPRPKPTFKRLAQANLMDFATMSGILENTGVAAFLTVMPAISNKDYAAAAASIVTIEARHAGFVNAVLGKPLSGDGAFDKTTSHAEVIKAVSPFSMDAQRARPRAEGPAHHARRRPAPSCPAARPGYRYPPAPLAQARRADGRERARRPRLPCLPNRSTASSCTAPTRWSA